MRIARGCYAQAINSELAEVGIDDLPRSGGFVLAYLIDDKSSEEIIRGLGVTKQAFSQLIETMVLRGFITRLANPDDRRRISLELSDRGRAAAEAVYNGVQLIDEELSRRLSSRDIAGLRNGLTALGEIKASMKP
jgi:DNA-binding MarR family transcriptional regulator